MKNEKLIKGIKWWADLLKNEFGLDNHNKQPIWYNYTEEDDKFLTEIIKKLEGY